MTIKSLKTEIKSLDIHCGEEDGNAESVIKAQQQLFDVLDTVSSQDGWDSNYIREYVLSEHDPLDTIDGVTESFCDAVREIQHGIINHYSIMAEQD